MGGMIPLTDASRRPTHLPIVTAGIILTNFYVFYLEIKGGDAFVLKWSAIPVNVIAGHHWITILTAMFMHGSWSHILGNMVFLWAFGPEIEDAMNPFRYLAFYLVGGVVAMLAQIVGGPSSTVPCLGASGAIAAVMGAFLVTYPRDQIRALLDHLRVRAGHFDPGGTSNWFLVSHPAHQRRISGNGPDGRSGLLSPRWWVRFRGCYRPSF